MSKYPFFSRALIIAGLLLGLFATVGMTGCGGDNTLVVLQDVAPLADGVCLPNCLDNECGDDGCGGVCGTCKGNKSCNENNQCECTPDCEDKKCGGDGCGGTCGICSSTNECITSPTDPQYGQCVCIPKCQGKNCGDDSCGGICGSCEEEEKCLESGLCAPSELPASPSALVATPISSTQIDLAWTDNAENETGYKVERADDGVNFKIVKTLGPDTESHKNTGLKGDTTYHYRVRAFHPGGDSDASEAVSVKTLSGKEPEWNPEVIEADGFEGVSGGAAIGIDNAKNQHVVFVSTDGFLRYAFRKNSLNTGWTFTVIDEEESVSLPAIVTPKFGDLHISYAAQKTGALKYATLDDDDNWVLETVDDTSFTTGYASAIHTANSEVFISYLETESPTQGTLRFAHRDIEGHWTLEKVDDIKYPEVSAYTGIGRDQQGNLHISYSNETAVMHAQKPVNANNWQPAIILDTGDSGLVGVGSGIGVESSGKVHAAFTIWNNPNTSDASELHHAFYSSGAWQTEIVQSDEKSDGLRNPRIVVDKGKIVHLAYLFDPDGNQATNTVRYATNRSGQWKLYDVDTDNEDIKHIYLAVDSSGTPYVLYVDDETQQMKYAKGKL